MLQQCLQRTPGSWVVSYTGLHDALRKQVNAEMDQVDGPVLSIVEGFGLRYAPLNAREDLGALGAAESLAQDLDRRGNLATRLVSDTAQPKQSPRWYG